MFLLPFDNLSKDSVIKYIEEFAMSYYFKGMLSKINIRKEFFKIVKEEHFLYETLKNHDNDEVEFLSSYIAERKNISKKCYEIIQSIEQKRTYLLLTFHLMKL